jgi:UDP-glucuronate decarboxylase
MLGSAAETPINLGNPNEFTMIELAELVIDITKSKSKLVKLPLPLDDPRQRCPDISKANSLLGWKPNIELREGIQRTTEYFKTTMRK